jgi:hypothetical protein
MRKPTIAMAVLALVLAFGCNQKNGATSSAGTNDTNVASTSSPSLTPEQLGELGAKLKAHPSDAQKILSDAGLTESSFESQIRKVSSDPEMSKRYAAAYKRAKA